MGVVAITAATEQEAVRLANAAGRDAAENARRRGNRAAWSPADMALALDTTHRALSALGFAHLAPPANDRA